MGHGLRQILPIQRPHRRHTRQLVPRNLFPFSKPCLVRNPGRAFCFSTHHNHEHHQRSNPGRPGTHRARAWRARASCRRIGQPRVGICLARQRPQRALHLCAPARVGSRRRRAARRDRGAPLGWARPVGLGRAQGTPAPAELEPLAARVDQVADRLSGRANVRAPVRPAGKRVLHSGTQFPALSAHGAGQSPRSSPGRTITAREIPHHVAPAARRAMDRARTRRGADEVRDPCRPGCAGREPALPYRSTRRAQARRRGTRSSPTHHADQRLQSASSPDSRKSCRSPNPRPTRKN